MAVDVLDEAVRVLRGGGLVAFPTETVYGLGADATSRDALRRLYAVKGRPAEHPVIVHLAGAGQLDAWAERNAAATRLAAAYWPGPLTLVLPRASGVLDDVTGGQDTVALRVPDHPLALELLERFRGGIAAPSANRFGRVSPTTAAHVRADLGDDVDLVLDGGPSRVGVESTIVDCTAEPVRVLRPGAVTRAEVAGVVGDALEPGRADAPRAPGGLPTHYAPRARVVVVDDPGGLRAAVAGVDPGAGPVGVLASTPAALAPGVVRLEAPTDPEGFARVLYDRLRAADRQGLGTVVVVPPSRHGVGAAVRERLARAAGEVLP